MYARFFISVKTSNFCGSFNEKIMLIAQREVFKKNSLDLQVSIFYWEKSTFFFWSFSISSFSHFYL